MILGERQFVRVGSLRLKRQPDGTLYTHRPQDRYAKADTTRLHRYGDGEFCEFALPAAPSKPGVYVMCIGNEVQYAGEADSLKRRFYAYGHISPKNCFQGGRQTNCRINKVILSATRDNHEVEVWFHSCDDRKEFEQKLLGASRPVWNL